MGWRHSLLLLAACALTSTGAQAQAEFPSRPVRIVVPFAAGGPTDVVMRALGDLLSARWGQPVLIENRPGAGTVLGTNYLAKAPPDGYTLGAALSAFVTVAAARASLPYDPLKDLTAVGMVTTTHWALVVNPSFPGTSVGDLVVEARRRPIDYAAPGIGGLGHMAGELLQRAAGIRMQFIPYGGSAVALTDVIAGRVPVMFDVWSSARPHVQDGKLKLIGAAGTKRLPDYPQVTTIAETYPGFEVTGFQGVIAPAPLPPPVLAKLAGDLQAVVRSQEFKNKMARLENEAVASTPAEFQAFLAREIAKWKEVARAANIRIE